MKTWTIWGQLKYLQNSETFVAFTIVQQWDRVLNFNHKKYFCD
uniref:Uncharacterized protein n=1 Tax=Arundo donax TaxID=35708 RepID=A0A0A8Z0Z3_ARUDO